MADIAVQSPKIDGTSAGLVYTTQACTVADSFINDGQTALIIDNGGAATHALTLDSVKKGSYGTDVDPTLSLLATEKAVIPFLNPDRFNDNAKIGGKVNMTWDTVEAGLVISAISYK